MRGTTNANYRFGETVGSGYVTVPPATNLSYDTNGTNVTLDWSINTSTPLSKAGITNFTRIDIRYKKVADLGEMWSGSFDSITDGTLVLSSDNTSLRSHTFTLPEGRYLVSVVTWGTVTGVTDAPVVPATSAEQIIEVIVSGYKKWTVIIDESNSNPLSCCTYADDAAGMTKGSSDWDEIFGYKPCVFYQGSVYKYLNPNDFTKFEDGTDATSYITNSGDAGYDVMIEFPRMGLTMSKSGTQVTISLTNNPNDSNFEYRAHKRGSTQKNAFYLGAYDACQSLASGVSGSTIGSISGKSPLVSPPLTQFINYAHLRGSGYEIMAFYQWTYVQCLYTLKYGNLNSQATFGLGVTSASNSTNSGLLDDQGMNYGILATGSNPVKLFGLENIWGNVYQWLSGLYSGTNTYTLFTTTDNFGTNTSVTAWEYNVSSGVTRDVSGYITKVQGTNDGGFIISASGGSSSMYFSDRGGLDSGDFPIVGGCWNDSDRAGVFLCYVSYSVSHSSPNIGSRLMFL